MAAAASPPFLLLLLLIPSISALPSSPSPSPLHRWAKGFRGAVAADERRCSTLGRRVLSDLGGNAADAAVAVAFCLGVVNPQSSGIGGGAFLLARFNSTVTAYDLRESAPGAATADMYRNDSAAQLEGGLSVGTPGEVAGLYELWRRHGRLPWRDLVNPAAEMARKGFTVEKYLAKSINTSADYILADPGLRNVFAPNGTLLHYGDRCFRPALASTLAVIARRGPDAFYTGPIAADLVADVQAHGGILTLDDLASYSVKLRQPTVSDVLGLTVYGMPPPSSGGACLAMVLNILAAYPDPHDAVRRPLGLHRMVEAFKYAFAARMYLGDPDFVDVSDILSEMLNASVAAEIQQLINDNQTFPPPHYGSRWDQVEDHGTSHFNVVDEERNVVSMTSTVNYAFGAKFISESTGIVLNNEMGDFSVPEEGGGGGGTDTPPSINNFIEPYKRPLSAMSPTIVVKDGELLGVLGGSGGVKIITTTIQVFLDVFWKDYGAVESVMRPRLHHQLMPDELDYEDWTAAAGETIRERKEVVAYLSGKGHNMTAKGSGAAAQLIVQAVGSDGGRGEAAAAAPSWRRRRLTAEAGELTAVSDLRKDGYPAAF